MNITFIKNKLNNRIGDNVKIIYNGSRNRREEFSGVISETYNYIFVVKIDDKEKKSFSYSDVLTNTIEIVFDNI